MKPIFILAVFLFSLNACRENTPSEPVSVIESKQENSQQVQEQRNLDSKILRQKKIQEQLDISIPDYIDLNYVTGRFEPSTHPMFEPISSQYTDRKNLLMHKEAYKAYRGMYVSAKTHGINLVIKSATRNFDYQGSIWGRKWRGETLLENKMNASKDIDNDLDRVKEIMKFSSMPGTSRHHWGTDIDINNFTNAYFEKGKGKAEYDWLRNNAHKFGFYQSYTSKNSGRTGYEEEKWHWSYMPIAVLCQEVVKRELDNRDIAGFPGYEQAVNIDVKNNYIFGLDNFCIFYGTD